MQQHEHKYYQIELFTEGITQKGFGKLSECGDYMTLIFHDHKNKWLMRKSGISEQLFKGAKEIEKNVFDTIVNQNLANL